MSDMEKNEKDQFIGLTDEFWSNFQSCQQELRELRASGVDDITIRKAMVKLGIGHLSPEQFLSIKTMEAALNYCMPAVRRKNN